MYKRLLVKFSGELFGGKGECFSAEHLRYMIDETKKVIETGAKIAIVPGGGNIFRGRIAEHFNLHNADAHKIGTLAGTVNALMLQEVMRAAGLPARAFTALGENVFLERYTIDRGRESLSRGEVVIVGGGSTNPYFTHDTAGVLRALELNCDVMVKATTVDGVYDSDPKKNAKAVKFETLNYEEAIAKNLQVMDQTAFVLAMQEKLPIVVYDAMQAGALLKIAQGGKVGTLVSDSPVVTSTLETKKADPITLSFSSALPAGELLKKLGKGMMDTR